MTVHITQIETPELGNRSYVVDDGRVAVVIDPQRDLDRVEEVLADRDVAVAAVAETHMHNDYVTGGYVLAQRHQAPYVVNAADPVNFDRRAVADGDVLVVGGMRVQAVATPGHTDTHLSYVITDADDEAATPAVFTGGSLLFGSVGRTDLVDPDRTEELTHAQYRSARRLADLLPEDAAVYPTHGFGSFCSSGATTGADASTIGTERRTNDALTNPDEDDFVRRLVAGLTAYPAYYAHMGPLNQQGPGAADLGSPLPVEAEELTRRLTAGEWVVDLRDRRAYAADHMAGSVGIELGQQFSTYLGWLAPWGAPLTLIGKSQEQIADAQRQLVRIGIDQLAGAAAGDLDEIAGTADRAQYPRVTFANLSAKAPQDIVLDVRRADERTGGYIAGSAHVPLHRLLLDLPQLPAGRLWVHCRSGYRASIAASLLDRAGRDVVLIDDDFDDAAQQGVEIVHDHGH
ncbi:MBL fold metallo-hydrolase [Flexivirga sp. ID2601S]|uniref:MBL fold metallo-hydrolase n=1 Tax=Flexivirga aerilata TaxID=1656889 RepID=A0A849AXE4_9MICO|nr:MULTISPECIES: MBL fold metallo-hydrolase [Flexivirga]NNG41322.1 MBL fold metallo-hydrolase [Flexivirga aerilata]